MKILVIGPSPHMKHDPGKIVHDFINESSKDHELFGCFFHHDFSKHPIDPLSGFNVEDKSIPTKWIDSQKDNGAVIESYDSIMDFSPEAIVSFGQFSETDFIRAALETSGKEIIWIHVLTISNHIHDLRFCETLKSINHIFSYSESQIENLKIICDIDKENISLIERNFEVNNRTNNKNIDIVFGGWNTEAYNLKSIFEAISDFNCSSKCLTNYYEYGDFDLESLSVQYGLNKNLFPFEFSNLFQLPKFEEWDYFIENSKIFIDMSMSQNSCLTLKRACWNGSNCVVIDTPRHREIYKELPNIFLVKSSCFFSSSGIKLYIPDHLDLRLKVKELLHEESVINNPHDPYSRITSNSKKEFKNLLNKLDLMINSRRFISLESIT